MIMEETKKQNQKSGKLSAAKGFSAGITTGAVGVAAMMPQEAHAEEVIIPEPVTPDPQPVKTEPVAPSPQPTPVEPVIPEPITPEVIVPEPVPVIEVQDYQRVDMEDGSQIDMAVVSVDGQQVGVFDVDIDGQADLIISDEDGDGLITDDEVHDVSGMGIEMQPLQDEYESQHILASPEPDYINDGNVDSYMA